MEKSEKESIELLPEKKFEEYPLSKKLTTWIINVGRIIIIFTELIAFSVFIGRIKLDRELTDLTEALENQLLVVENAEEFAKDFQDLQQRIATIKKLRREQVSVSPTVSLLTSLLPQDVELTGLTLGGDEAYFLAKTGSATAFAQTILNLKSSPQIKEITLTSGRFQAKDNTYNFSLAIKFGGF